MNQDMQLRLVITADGKVAVSVVAPCVSVMPVTSPRFMPVMLKRNEVLWG